MTDEAVDYYIEYAESLLEIANASSFTSQRGMGLGSNNEIKIEDVQKYLQNPYEHLEEVLGASAYLTNKHGVLRDVIRMVRSLPTLKYSLHWTLLSDNTNLDEYERIANVFLDEIGVVDVVRDGLDEVAELGTVIMCLRSKKYVQFLPISDVVIRKQRDGKWVVEFDLETLNDIRDDDERSNKIESLPDEITEAKYDSYKKNNSSEDERYIEIANCVVVSLDAKRNSPYGLPMTMGAWLPILQKELINKVERSVSDRLIKQILVLSAGHMDKEGKRPVPKELIDFYFRQVSELIRKKDAGVRDSGDNSGTGVIAFPNAFELSALQVDTTMFKRELYDKIDNDIFMNLGVSQALVYGEGGNYSSAMVNSEKFFSFMFSLVGQFETAINGFLELILPNDVICKIKFDKSTVLDKQAVIRNRKDLYLQTSLLTPWIEAVMDAPLSDVIELRKREEELNLDELFFPAKNAYTSSSDDDVGRPVDEETRNDETQRSRSSGGNNNPSPSD